MNEFSICLIDANGRFNNPGTFLRHSIFEPIGLEYVAASTKQAGHEVNIFQQNDLSEEQFASLIINSNPAVVGFSSFTCNFKTSRNIAQLIKNYDSNIITVFGGSHPSAVPEIVEDNCIDFVIIGEGEKAFPDLINYLTGNSPISPDKIPGVAFYRAGKMVVNKAKRILNIDNLPKPIRNVAILEQCKIFSLCYPTMFEQVSVAQISYSRGCPFNCYFCSSRSLWGKNVIFRETKIVADEIEYLIDKYNTNYVFFTDLTFNLVKSRLMELCQEFIRRDLRFHWYAMCRMDGLDNEMIDIMAEAGCSKLAFGIDSTDTMTLKKIKPGQKFNLEASNEILNYCNHKGIIVRAYLIIGFPWDTFKSIENISNSIQELDIDDLRISYFTPLPGSQSYVDCRDNNLLVTEDWDRYTTDEPIVKIPDLSIEELLSLRKEMFYGFYNSKKYSNRVAEKISRFPKLKQSFIDFSALLSTTKDTSHYC